MGCAPDDHHQRPAHDAVSLVGRELLEARERALEEVGDARLGDLVGLPVLAFALVLPGGRLLLAATSGCRRGQDEAPRGEARHVAVQRAHVQHLAVALPEEGRLPLRRAQRPRRPPRRLLPLLRLLGPLPLLLFLCRGRLLLALVGYANGYGASGSSSSSLLPCCCSAPAFLLAALLLLFLGPRCVPIPLVLRLALPQPRGRPLSGASGQSIMRWCRQRDGSVQAPAPSSALLFKSTDDTHAHTQLTASSSSARSGSGS